MAVRFTWEQNIEGGLLSADIEVDWSNHHIFEDTLEFDDIDIDVYNPEISGDTERKISVKEFYDLVSSDFMEYCLEKAQDDYDES